MTRRRPRVTALALFLAGMGLLTVRPWAQSAPAIQPPAAKLPALGADKAITEADCTVEKIGAIPSSAIGEPVAAVTVNTAIWTPAVAGSQGTSAAQCVVDGSMAPVDKVSERPSDQLPRRPSRELESSRRPSRRRWHERRHSADDGRRSRARLRSLRQRLRPSDVVWRPPRCAGRRARPAAAGRIRERLGDQRRSDQEPRVHATQENARRGVLHRRAHLWRAAALQLLRRDVAGRTRGTDRRAALSSRLRRRRRRWSRS